MSGGGGGGSGRFPPHPQGKRMVHILSAVSVSVNDSPLSMCNDDEDDYEEEFDEEDELTPPSSAGKTFTYVDNFISCS